MEANNKLLKKKRIAHSQMSTSHFDEPKLPPDDFVYNIMKGMDSSGIMSYHLSQETKSKERGHSSKYKGQKLKNSPNRDSYCKKQDKRMLPKKSFPLMQKCQTSLKHLKKNRCIPKQRAHVGFINKPQVQPVIAVPSISKYENEKNRKTVKKTKIQSKAYSKVMESKLMKSSNTKSQQDKTTENDNLITQDDNGHNCSSSEDGDAAYESFIKKEKSKLKVEANEENISTDSDSLVIIRRKRSKSKQKRKKHKKQSFSNDGNKQRISKVTSIPLSDSSEDTFETNEKLKQKMVSPTRLHKQVCTDPLESYQSDSSFDLLPDLNTNNESSDEDFTVQAAATTLKGQRMDQNLASISVDSITMENQPSNDKNHVDFRESNELISSDSVNTKSERKYRIPCCVRLKRDPIIDKKAETYFSTASSSAVDCIVISDESDDEVSTSSLSLTSIVSSETPVSTKNTDIQKSPLDSDYRNVGDCIIMFEQMPKVGSSETTLNPESVHCSTKSISTDNKLTVDEGRTSTSTEINYEQSSNSGEAATHVSCERTFIDIEEFKVQIVAVKSLVGQSDSSIIAKYTEAEEIEIIDLSDEDLNSQEMDGPNKNFESVKEVGAEQHTKEGIQYNVNETIPFIPNDQDCYSQTLLSSPVQGISCEESPVQVQNISDTRILETLSKIDFEIIKKIINKTKSNTEEASTEGETLMTNVERHNSKLSTERDLLDSTDKNLSKTDASVQVINSAITSACVVSNDTSMESALKANASKNIPAINGVASETNFNATLNTELNKKIYVGEETTSTIINSESNPIERSGTGNRNAAMCNIGQQSGATDLQKTNEKPLIPVAVDSQLNSVPQMNIVETIIDKGQKKSLPRTIYEGKRKGIAIDDIKIVKKPKCENFESPSDELDVIAASFTKDLSTPNKTIDALLDLYKAEYAKYMNIINTEANVTLGLKMLHDKQLDKLTHLRSSIKNLVKHDPCYHTVIQEKYDSKAQACIKDEAKLKHDILIPTSSSEKTDISIHSKTDKVDESYASSSKESGNEVATHPTLTTKLEVKLTSSKERGIPTQSEVKEKQSVKTALKEKFSKYMKNIKCAECGKAATARCQGCAQVFYCSSQCGVLSWKKGHNVACKRSRM